MATLTAAACKAACDAVVDRVDLGSANASGRIVFRTAGGTAAATLVMSNPAFGAATSAAPSVATANSITADSSATGNASPVTYATIEDRDAAEVWRVTVTAPGGGGEFEIIGGTTINAGVNVQCNSFTHTQNQ